MGVSQPTPQLRPHLSTLLKPQYLAAAPLAEDRGVTTWVLAEKNRAATQGAARLLLTRELPKTVPHSDKDGNVEESLAHGIATRHMKELAQVLQAWQSEYGKSIGSILSGARILGGQFYAGLGWLPRPERDLSRRAALMLPGLSGRRTAIACAQRAGEGGDGADEPPVWLHNEYYAWC